MAIKKNTEEQTQIVENINEVEETVDVPMEKTTVSEISKDDILAQALLTIKQLSEQVNQLQNNSFAQAEKTSVYDDITIIHTNEMSQGLSTFIKLTNLSHNMHRLGETRTLTRQQFEELLGKYRHFFTMGIIALDMKHSEIAEREGLSCYDIKSGKYLTSQILNELPLMEIPALEKIFKSLSEGGQKHLINYWLNKCYLKEKGFYDRYKMEALNRMADTVVFGYLISEYDNISQQNQNKQ